MKFISTRLSVVVATLLLFASFLQGQSSSVYIEDLIVQEETFDLDVQVQGFTDILSTAFTLQWDPDKLSFVGVENLQGFLGNDSFNTDSASVGRLTFLYFDLSIQGNTLLDGEALFSIRFENNLGTDFMSTEVGFDTSRLSEMVNINETELMVDFNGGIVSNGTVNTQDVAGISQTSLIRADLVTNPFTNRALIDLQLATGGSLTWTLLDISGQVVDTQNKTYATGHHRLVLENTLFKQAGNYVLKLAMNGHTVSKKLVYVVP